MDLHVIKMDVWPNEVQKIPLVPKCSKIFDDYKMPSSEGSEDWYF